MNIIRKDGKLNSVYNYEHTGKVVIADKDIYDVTETVDYISHHYGRVHVHID